MDTKQLITFVTLAELNNYIRASERLNYAPSTLAKHIQSLEEELGVKLVEFRGKKICLTPEGERFHGYAVKIIDTYWEAAEAFSSPGGMRGSIRLAGGEPIVGLSLARQLLNYSTRYPEVELNVQMTCCARVPQWIRDRETDIGYIHEMEREGNGGYAAVPLYNEPICLVTTPNNPLSDSAGAGYRDMEGQKFAFTYHDCCFTMAFRERLRREGIAPASELFLGSVSAVLKSVRHDDRIALIPYSSLPHLPEQGLTCLTWKDEPVRPWVKVICDRARKLNPAEKELIRQAEAFAGELIQNDAGGQLRA